MRPELLLLPPLLFVVMAMAPMPRRWSAGWIIRLVTVTILLCAALLGCDLWLLCWMGL